MALFHAAPEIRVKLNEEQIEALKHWTSLLTWSGVVLNAVVIFVNLADRRKRAFPARLTTFDAAVPLASASLHRPTDRVLRPRPATLQLRPSSTTRSSASAPS